MKKILFILTLLVFCFENTNAQKHVSVLGTKFSLIPPDGFTSASNFSGFQNAENGSSIMITEIPSSYFIVSKGFTAEALKTKGMILKLKEKVDFKGKEATFLQVSQAAYGTTYLKQILMFGDENKTIMINGIYPDSSKEIESEIKKSLFSTIYNDNQNDNPFDAVKFSIDIKETDYKFVKYLSGSLLYSEDGNLPTDKGIFIVSTSVGKFSEFNHKQHSIERLKKLPNGELSKIKEVNPIVIDNLNGFEIIANGKNADSQDEIVYQVILYNKSEYYILVGQASNDQIQNLEIFKKIAKTFKLK
ncbi:hypothetical protein [Flavobacterium sp.]|uniref:hypothetical protein n=1 Tax=Flavobacterium sp. TaxID=239 RepID=UPI002627A0E7|nr:hypothetical protein [Flavobacterium sp.]